MASKAAEVMNKAEQSYIDEIGEEKPLELYVSECQPKRTREKENKEKTNMRKRERIQKYAGCNVFVKNLEDNCNEDWLRDYFTKFGTITSLKIARTENHTSLGHGFICFSAPEEATEAIKQTNRKQIPPWTKPFYANLHQPADERRQLLQRENNFNITRNSNLNGIMQMQQTFNPAYAMQPNPYHLGIPAGLNQFGRPMGPYGGMLPNQRGPSAILRYNQFPTPGVPYQQHIYDTRGPMMPHYVPRGPKKNPRSKVPGGNRGQAMQMGGQPPMIPDMHINTGAPNQPLDAYNQGQGMVMQNQQQSQQQGRGAQGNMGINTEKLAELPEDQRKLTLGEKLYPLVATLNAENAPKITGMILELENTEILNLLEDNSALKDKVEEAVRVLNEYVEK